MKCTVCNAEDSRTLLPPHHICFYCLSTNAKYNCLDCNKNVLMENLTIHKLETTSSEIEPRCLSCTLKQSTKICPKCNELKVIMNTGMCFQCGIPKKGYCLRCTKYRRLTIAAMCEKCTTKAKKENRGKK